MRSRRWRKWTVGISSWDVSAGCERANRSELEAGAKRKIELAAVLVVVVALDGNAVVEAQRGARHHQAQPDAEVVIVTAWVPIVCRGVDEAHVVEHRETDRVNDLDGVL